MKKELSAKQKEALLHTLKTRFEKNSHRDKGIEWTRVHAKLEANPGKLWSLNEMEITGGEPDVVAYDKKINANAGQVGEYIFYDCSAQSPDGRRSVCYDREALDVRKEFKPKNSVIDMAVAMGFELLTEVLYRALQQLEHFRYYNIKLDISTC